MSNKPLFTLIGILLLNACATSNTKNLTDKQCYTLQTIAQNNQIASTNKRNLAVKYFYSIFPDADLTELNKRYDTIPYPHNSYLSFKKFTTLSFLRHKNERLSIDSIVSLNKISGLGLYKHIKSFNKEQYNNYLVALKPLLIKQKRVDSIGIKLLNTFIKKNGYPTQERQNKCQRNSLNVFLNNVDINSKALKKTIINEAKKGRLTGKDSSSVFNKLKHIK